MDKELKEKWVAALRSGDYPQTNGELKNCEGFCCLGVLVDVALGKEAWDNYSSLLYCGNEELLNEDLGEDLGITFGMQKTLAGMNDGEGDCSQRSTFAEIADYIEEYL
jgi:hypothetical protein